MPPKLPVSVLAVGRSNQGAMKMSNCGDVPGVTGQAACTEAERVVEKMANDHFDDLLGEPVGRGQACCGGLRGYASRADPPDLGFASIPKSHGEQLDDWEHHDRVQPLMISLERWTGVT